ncbi:MAG: hypothetical protein HRT74_12050, partial [Flavobacteriales bacterium]|nr:hypothetical protein [Flavobacteriales bacterium]
MKKNLRLLIILVILTIGAGLLWKFQGNGSSSIADNPLANFAIEDTSLVARIVIVDNQQNRVQLDRQEGERYWSLNDTYLARKDAVDLLLKTFKRIAVKNPVPKTMRETALARIQEGKKVFVFDKDGNELKTYLVGSATSDHTGTFMLLEEGNVPSSEPFITHMEGFTGFLSTRFFTDVEEWRYTGIFDYPKLGDIQQIEVIHHHNETSSFDIALEDEGKVRLHSRLLDRDMANFDTLAVKDYALLYKKVHLETYQSHLSPAGEDSLLNTQPAFTLRVIEESGKRKKIDVYFKPNSNPYVGDNGEVVTIDEARMYGVVNGDDVVLIQTFV